MAIDFASWGQFVVALLIFGASGIAGIVHVTNEFRNVVDRVREEFKTHLQVLEKCEEEKRKRIYERFDEYKDFVEDTFVRNDMCGQKHTTTAAAVEGLNRRFETLEKKIDELMRLILKGQSEEK